MLGFDTKMDAQACNVAYAQCISIIGGSRKCYLTVPALLKSSTLLAPANTAIISRQHFSTIGSRHVKGNVAEKRFARIGFT